MLPGAGGQPIGRRSGRATNAKGLGNVQAISGALLGGRMTKRLKGSETCDDSLSPSEAAALIQLGRIVEELEAMRFQLLGVQASVPISPLERDPLLETDSMDVATEIRSAIGCVLTDRIDPALRELRAAAYSRHRQEWVT